MLNPNAWADERMGTLSHRQRLMRIGITTMSDDEGRFHANAAMIRAQIFPYDELSLADIENDLKAIAETGMIMLYERDGRRYGWDPDWYSEQKPSHPTPSVLPPPPVPLSLVENKTPGLPFASDSGISPENSGAAREQVSQSVSHGSVSDSLDLGEDQGLGQVSGRWTFDQADKGNFIEIELWTAYQSLTGNHPTDRDKEAMTTLRESNFSSKALVSLFQMVKTRSRGKPIHSLNYFASAVAELALRVAAAEVEAAKKSVGGTVEERFAMRQAAIRREIENWDNRIAQKFG
jgi:hypothetical protein